MSGSIIDDRIEQVPMESRKRHRTESLGRLIHLAAILVLNAIGARTECGILHSFPPIQHVFTTKMTAGSPRATFIASMAEPDTTNSEMLSN